jgi:hypothetical protein
MRSIGSMKDRRMWPTCDEPSDQGIGVAAYTVEVHQMAKKDDHKENAGEEDSSQGCQAGAD